MWIAILSSSLDCQTLVMFIHEMVLVMFIQDDGVSQISEQLRALVLGTAARTAEIELSQAWPFISPHLCSGMAEVSKASGGYSSRS